MCKVYCSKMISDQDLYYHYSLITLFVLALLTFILVLFVNAPYGKHYRPGWGPTIPPSLAWFLMECPTVLLTLLVFPRGKNSQNPRALLLISHFLIHYIHRSFIYPLRLFLQIRDQSVKTSFSNYTISNSQTVSYNIYSKVKVKKPGFPVIAALFAFGFNILNGYVQARTVSEYVELDGKWFWIRVGSGGLVFVGGMVVNVWSDYMLMGLKRKSRGGYGIPMGGLFGWVSGPNYLGEMMEWFGWAVMTWSWAGFGFLLYTCSNLVPRSWACHKWYLEKFGEEYPKNRRAIIPFLFKI